MLRDFERHNSLSIARPASTHILEHLLRLRVSPELLELLDVVLATVGRL